MPFIKESLADVAEPKAAPEGEYELRVVKAVDNPSKKGEEMLTVTFAFDDGTNAPPFNEYFMGWDDGTDDNQKAMRKLALKRFCACFDVAEDFEPAELKGLTGTSFVIQEAGQDGVVRNRIRLPRIKE